MSAFDGSSDHVELSTGDIYAQSIIFVDEPRHYRCHLPRFDTSDFEEGNPATILNYSQLYSDLVEQCHDEKKKDKLAKIFLAPKDIMTGDVIQSVDYRGVDSHYAVWLHKDAFQNPSILSYQTFIDENVADDMSIEHEFTAKKKRRVPSKNDEKSYFDFENNFKSEEFVDEEGHVMNAAELVESLPPSEYPLEKSREELQASINQHAEMSCYLFRHCDEMGYSAPTAVSMARNGYFPNEEYHARDIDLTLLPPPLQEGCNLGKAVHQIKMAIAASHKKVEKNIALVDLVTEDMIFYFTISEAEECFGFSGEEKEEEAEEEKVASESPLKLTRSIFQRHAALIQESVVKQNLPLLPSSITKFLGI